jgi:hypothetical protein
MVGVWTRIVPVNSAGKLLYRDGMVGYTETQGPTWLKGRSLLCLVTLQKSIQRKTDAGAKRVTGTKS